jgi:membrane fusion protein (multidrug efflux system)
MAQDNQQTNVQGQNHEGDKLGVVERNGNGKAQQVDPPGPPDDAANGNKSDAPAFTQSPIFKVVAAIVLIVAIVWGYNFWNYTRTHVSTDDAYVTGDLINVSPIISGTLAKLTVDEGDTVAAGQVIAVLDKSGPQAAYDQARAAYEAAESQIPQAQTNLEFEAATVSAAIDQAKAALGSQQAKTAQSERQVNLTAQTTHSEVDLAQASAAAALAQAATAEADAKSSLQAVQTAKNAAQAAHEQVDAAQANYIRAQKDEDRYRSLYGQSGQVAAVTVQQLDQAVDAADSAHAQLEAATDQAMQADSQVNQALAGAAAAQAAADAAMKQYAAAMAQTKIAQANLIQVPVQKFGAASNVAITRQSAAELQAAMAQNSQVELRRQQVVTAQATAEQALAAMKNAKVTLDDCTISAPTAGVVVRKGVNVGDALTPGQTIVTMTQGTYTWIDGNFKETQLESVRPGQPVEIDVDAFPGKVFHGKVQSINEASGNTTSLLPADNATGNFTKVVQRIPVKIVLVVPPNPGPNDATQADIDNLRQGMSCEPNIDISSALAKPQS